DALAVGDTSLMKEPFRIRRQALIEGVSHRQWCHVTRTTEDPALGAQWLEEFEGAGLDGVIAKRLDGPYLPGKREMIKVKHHRDADCVAIGYRIHKSGEGIGSILLGLHREDGELQMVGGAASFTAQARRKLLAELEPLRIGDDVRDGEPSRWNSAADKRWIPIRPEKVCEVAYDQMEGNSEHRAGQPATSGQGRRFRHAVKFLRWRPDRDPESCRFDQLDVPLNYDLNDVLEKPGGAVEATGKRN
ncbi:ATP-dependent DNA ligase, partial [Mycobacterium sp. ITM-2017-0098]